MRGLYIHIPFCKHICNYCDFHKMVTFNEEKINKYIDEIIKELDSYSNYLDCSVKTVYIGGGTPNILSDFNLEKLLNKIKSLELSVEEFSIEINPELLTKSQALLFKKYNVNRVSIGAETFNDYDAKILGRHHTFKDTCNAIELLKDVGINNINVDLIYGYPNDTLENVRNTLNTFISLNIPHISYYSLILEEKTIFYNKWLKGDLKLPSDDDVADMMEYISKFLSNNGFKHYEISNYAKEGFESQHNKIYWKTYEYIGIGAGASGYLDGIRYDNNYILSNYCNSYRNSVEKLDIEDKKKEFFMMGLRMLEGVSIDEYKRRFNSDPFNDFSFELILKYGLINIDSNIIKLTFKGYMLANVVFEEFI